MESRSVGFLVFSQILYRSSTQKQEFEIRQVPAKVGIAVKFLLVKQ